MMSGTPVVASPTLLQALHRSNHAKSPLANASFIDGDIDGSVSVSSLVTEVFSTPPSSPFPVNPANTPTTAHVGGAFALKSPPAARSIGKALASSSLARVEITNGESEQNNHFAAIDMASPSQTHPTQTLSLPNNNQPSRRGDASVPVSPFFVHSLLDQGASYRSFLEQNHIPSPLVSTHAQAASASRSNTMSTTSSSSNSSSPSDASMPNYQSSVGAMNNLPNSGPGSIPATTMGGSGTTEYASSNHSATAIESDYSLSEFDDDEGNDGNSLTKQLAETAVGVRELAKQLGAFYAPPSDLLPSC
ncbi:hypothetical protein DL93DRAFT_783868 [Clavulina sp. PMI_390]|nr:hypothetical protein DL93DRAFT_783868 [Clavulina sp. PMI_390]